MSFKIKNNFYKNIFFNYLVILIPFLDFINVNFHKIDFIVYKQLFIYFLFLIVCYSIFIFLLNFFVRDFSKIELISLVLSFSFWVLFKYEALRGLFSFINNFKRDFYFLQSLSAFILLMFLIIIFFFLIGNSKQYSLIKKFFYYFVNIQIIIVIFSILILVNDNFFFLKEHKKNNLNEENFFSYNEIKKINKSSNNKNIYYIIMDTMTSLEQYEEVLKKNNILTDQIKDKINNYKTFFIENNFTYIENSFSTYRDTHHTIGSILNLRPLKIDHLDKTSIKYQSTLYPSVLSKNNFEIKNYPSLIRNLNNINYSFKWVGYKLDCRFINQDLCYYNENNKEKQKFLLINYYILKSFLINTPIIETYSFFRNRFNLNINLPDREKISITKFGDLNSRNEVTSKFIKEVDKFKKHNKNYFYLIHNLLPSDTYIFDNDCKKKNHTNDIDIKLIAYNYSQGYQCALKIIKKFIKFINIYDPSAIVIFQADHGLKINNKSFIDKYRIFNLIKVPKICDKYLSNEIDNVNAVRLALSCATNSKIKLLERKLYSE